MAHSSMEHFEHVKYSFDPRAFICTEGECFAVPKDLFTHRTQCSQTEMPRNTSSLVCKKIKCDIVNKVGILENKMSR